MFWKRKGIVGVSLRDDAVRVLQFKKTSAGRIVQSHNHTPLKKGVIVSGAIKDHDQLVIALRNACQTALPKPIIMTNAQVALALPEAKTFVRIITLPKMPQEQIAQAVRWEMEEYIPLPVEEVYFDWQCVTPTRKGEKEIPIAVVATARNVVDEYTAVIRDAGMAVVSVEPDSMAEARALVHGEDVQDGAMVITCGQSQSHLSIIVDGMPLFTVTVPVGTGTFAADIMRALNVTQKEADRILTTEGIGSYITHDPLFEAVAPGMRTLAQEMRKSADFCLQTLAQCRTVRIAFIAGRGATVKGLRAFLVKESGISVKIAQPWRYVQRNEKLIPPLSRTEALDAVVVIGLASRNITYADLN